MLTVWSRVETLATMSTLVFVELNVLYHVNLVSSRKRTEYNS